MFRTLFLTLSLLGMAGCAGPSYWHEPPGPTTANTESDIWQGMMRSGARYYYTSTSLMSPVSVHCVGYADLIRFEREGSRLRAMLGQKVLLDLNLVLDADGRFSTVVPVTGDTWVYGGVMLLDDEPVLHLWGRLDQNTGLGEGRINVSPGDERLGCPGRFLVSRNGGPPPASEMGAPFKVQYWIDELDINDNWSILGHWPYRRHW
ncbi:hypothetical protein KQ940_17345 [Marinobacterium sp. D7]|uniref:hypothetical protein n=1 Tax=Marinobacterium ramblicola TaxID=2849041 RepID=UPI001C2DCBC0|nr:hypothetical protein [Marinobacterium ramblicola]MBV1789824.1 hypothetical protein [Marinobacterium ramblicola]